MLFGREPLREWIVHRCGTPYSVGVGCGHLRAQLAPALTIRVVRDHQDGRRAGDVAVHHILRRVPEERRHGVELALCDRIELVIVAGGAADRQAQEHVAGRLGSVLGIDRFVLLGNGATFVGRDVVAVKAGRHQLRQRWIGQQIAGDLLDGELVKRLVVVERLNHPIAIGIHLTIVIDVDAVRIAIARGVEPEAGAVLTPVIRLEQAVDQLFVRPVGTIVQEARERRRVGR